MTRTVSIKAAGPGVSIQDQGRPGFLSFGVSQGGAIDQRALWEGAALLRQSEDLAVIEMAGLGGEFVASEDLVIALTGAEMRASIAGDPLLWNASHRLPKGAVLAIAGVTRGSYGYLHFEGGIAIPQEMGSRSTHLAAGIGRALQAGDTVPVGPANSSATPNMTLTASTRLGGGSVRVVPSLQTHLFATSEITRFEDTMFTRGQRGNRMGVAMASHGPGFAAEAGRSILSEVIVPGDIQITGDGTPYVLMCECQTTGGYPRIGSVLPTDLPIVAQAQPGMPLRFTFVTLEDAVAIELRDRQQRADLKKTLRPLIRDPRDIPDLLSHQLISGAVAAELDTPK
ncbi:MAG: biotin-dependent carboxyltransferase family protein [Pseudomonadota bacterium]